jgi:hypothetical protein
MTTFLLILLKLANSTGLRKYGRELFFQFLKLKTINTYRSENFKEFFYSA